MTSYRPRHDPHEPGRGKDSIESLLFRIIMANLLLGRLDDRVIDIATKL